MAEQPRLPRVERLLALAKVVLERLVHGVVHDVLVDADAKRPDGDALGDRQCGDPFAEVGSHAVDGARQLVAVPQQQVALGAVDPDAEDVERRGLVATFGRQLAAAALGQAQQPCGELRLTVLRVDPEVGLELAGAELVAGVRVADESPRRSPTATHASRASSKPSMPQSLSTSSAVVSGAPTSATSQALSRSTTSGRSPRVAGLM